MLYSAKRRVEKEKQPQKIVSHSQQQDLRIKAQE